MGLYTRITRDWLERRFARRSADGSHFAHMPIYGAGAAGCEGGHLTRLARLFRLLRVLDGLQFDTLVDIGGAEGYLAHLARTVFGSRAGTCDLSVQACLRAREVFGLPGAAVDATRLPFCDDAFDVVVCSEVIEHVEHPVPLVLELQRVARKVVVLSTEEIRHDRRFLDAYLFRRPGWPHMERNLFHPDDIRTLLPGAELQPQFDAWPPDECPGPDQARAWLLANTRQRELSPDRIGVIAVERIDPEVARPRHRTDEELADLLLRSTVQPGVRHSDRDSPLPDWFTAALVDPRTREPLHRRGDDLLAADGRRYPCTGGVPDFVDLELPDPDRALLTARLADCDPARRAALLELHDRLFLPGRVERNEFDFRRREDRRGFWANDQLVPRPGGEGFAFRSRGADPWILSPCLDRRLEALELELRIHNPGLPVAEGNGQVFWKGPDDETFGEDRCVSFRVPNDGRFHVHRVELAGHPRMPDVVQWLRIDPVDGPCDVDLRSLRLH